MRKKWLVIPGAIIGAVVVGSGAVLVTGGVLVPAKYLEPWSADYATSFDDPRLALVAHGVLAPSGHNMQPWKIRLDTSDPEVFELYADPERLTPAVDPLSRQTMVTQGTFLEYLRVAGDKLGTPVSIELFPDGDYDESRLAESMAELPVARITITEAAPVDSPEYASLFRSDTNRSAYTDTPLTAAQIAELAATSTDAGTTIRILSSAADKKAMAGFAVAGSTIESTNAPAMEEAAAVFHSNEWQKNDARSGFSVEGQGTTGFMMYFLQGLITIVPSLNTGDAAAQRTVDLTVTAVAATPAYALITTTDNTRVEQVQAGMTYSAFELRARSLGLVMQPLSQVLQEYPDMKEQYDAVHAAYAPDGSTIQMLVRLGTPTAESPVTMRRDISSLMIDEG